SLDDALRICCRRGRRGGSSSGRRLEKACGAADERRRCGHDGIARRPRSAPRPRTPPGFHACDPWSRAGLPSSHVPCASRREGARPGAARPARRPEDDARPLGVVLPFQVPAPTGGRIAAMQALGGLVLHRMTGDRARRHLADVAALRIRVFADWPYLYAGDLDYEQDYLAAYAASPRAVFVLALDGERVVGAST